MQHSPRLLLPRPNLLSEGASDSPVDLPQLFHDRDSILDTLSWFGVGRLADRPPSVIAMGVSSGVRGRIYISTDIAGHPPRLDWDSGAGWNVIGYLAGP